MWNKTRLKARWRNLDPVWRFNTRHARKLYKKWSADVYTGFNPNHPDRKKHSLVYPILQNGINTGHIDDWFPGENLYPALKEYTESFNTGTINPFKPFLVEHWSQIYELDFANPFTMFALHPTVLHIAADYLGCLPRLHDIRLWMTRVNKGEEKIYSQKWHRDPEDKQLLNLFLYLSDVDEGSGPFEYIPESHRFGKFWKKFPQILPPQSSYPGDVKVETFFGPGERRVCMGNKGSVIFADTAGLHKGGFSTVKPRLMFKALFISDGNFRDNVSRFTLPKNLPELTDIQKYAIRAL